MWENGIFILYFKSLNFPTQSATPWYDSNSRNYLASVWSESITICSIELGNIEGLWKKLIEPEKFTKI